MYVMGHRAAIQCRNTDGNEMLSQRRPIFIFILAENQRHGVSMFRYPHEGGDSWLEDGPVEGVPALLP